MPNHNMKITAIFADAYETASKQIKYEVGHRLNQCHQIKHSFPTFNTRNTYFSMTSDTFYLESLKKECKYMDD